jgi:hypothetical protein
MEIFYPTKFRPCNKEIAKHVSENNGRELLAWQMTSSLLALEKPKSYLLPFTKICVLYYTAAEKTD